MRHRRYHHLDWLRVLAFGLLVFFHTGMIFVSWDFHIKASETSESLEILMTWLHAWRMPLLFVISGMGTAFALRRRTNGGFLAERARRLLIPLLFGMLVVVPPQIYVERIDQYASFWAFYPTVFELVPYPLGGSLSWHHLWFILYLFVQSVVLLPALLWLKRSDGAKSWIRRRIEGGGGFGWFFLPLISLHVVLMPFFPRFTHALIDDWARFAHYGMFLWAGFALATVPGAMDRLYERRHSLLAMVGVWLVPFYLVRLWPDIAPGGLALRPTLFGYDVLYWIPTSAMGWYVSLTVLGYGRAYLERPSRALSYLNDAVYPFYIWHQTVLIVVGAWVIEHVGGIGLPFALIVVATYAVTLAIYHFAVRPFSLMRRLHGLKPKPVPSVNSPGAVAAERITPVRCAGTTVSTMVQS